MSSLSRLNKDLKRFFLAAFIMGCAQSNRPKEIPKSLWPSVRTARANLSQFITALQNENGDSNSFAIKAEFWPKDEKLISTIIYGSNRHYIWVSDLRYENNTFFGKQELKKGNLSGNYDGKNVSIHKSKIIDWMYTQNRCLKGGYTLRYLRGKLPPAKRKQFDKQNNFIICKEN